MDASRYMTLRRSGVANKTVSAVLPEHVCAELKELKESFSFNTSAWVRDLIIEHLPEAKRQLARSKKAG